MSRHFLGSKHPLLGVVALTACVLATNATAQGGKPPARAGALEGVVKCRSITDSAERLACYDSAVGSFDEAEKKGDVVVMDREQTRAARRDAFGFSLPSLAIFERGQPEAEITAQTFKVERAYRSADGRWSFVLEGGAVWKQIDNEEILREPKTGSTAEIRTASLGSFFLKVDGQRAIRASRVK